MEAREVLRCDHCSLVQFLTSTAMCRRCHKTLKQEEPVLPMGLVSSNGTVEAVEEDGIRVDRAVREARRMRHLSQRQLAGRMQVPRTYISKIENGKATPTLSSLERLATALELTICDLLRDSHSRRQEETVAIFADPFMAEIIPCLGELDAFQRSIILNHARDLATGRRRSA
jgi:transcriptional regulator with XRE-family HTH domain